MDFAGVIDIGISIATLIGTLATGAGAVWVFFRKRLRAWWAPYRAGIDAMAEVPAMRTGIESCDRNLGELRSSMGLIALHMRARADINIEAAEFECDSTGACTYANRTYARWLGVGKADLIGWNWINYLHPDDRIAVRHEWDACRQEHRIFSKRYRLVDDDGEEILVDTLVTPIPDAPPAKQWLGMMRRVVT